MSQLGRPRSRRFVNVREGHVRDEEEVLNVGSVSLLCYVNVITLISSLSLVIILLQVWSVTVASTFSIHQKYAFNPPSVPHITSLEFYSNTVAGEIEALTPGAEDHRDRPCNNPAFRNIEG
jgi:hypothetical protein